MSGNVGPSRSSEDKGRKKEDRDVSPSTYSQSSGLEWDPSADVGTTAKPSQPSLHSNSDPSSDRPRISRSRSYEYPLEDDKVQDLVQSKHKTSLGELAKRPQKLVTEWTKRFVNIEFNDGSFLDTMVGGFNTRRDILSSAFQQERPASSNSTTVSTVMPPPLSRSDSHKTFPSDEEDKASLPKEFHKLDEDDFQGKYNLPRTYSNSKMNNAPVAFQEITPRSHSMVELAAYGSTTAPTVGTGSGPSKLSRSDFSAEISNSKHFSRDNSEATNDRSLISEWLEVGMTKSEKQYKKDKEYVDSGSGQSMLYIALEQNLKNDPEGFRNIGIQTSNTLLQPDSEEILGRSASQFSSIYHSTPTDRQRPSNLPSKSRHEANDSKPKRGRSPPQPFAVASRRSSHQQHHANHTRNHDTEYSSLMANNVSRHGPEATSSSDLSPPCFLIDKLAKSAKSPLKKNEIVNAIEIHRDYHVKKVKHELRQLEKLNQLLSKNIRPKHQRPANSEPDSSREQERSQSATATRRKSPLKNKSSSKIGQKISNTTSSASTTPKDSSLSMEMGSRKSISDQNVDTKNAVEKKLDELMDAFSFIAGMLLEKDNDKDKANDASQKPKSPRAPSSKVKRKVKELIKPPVAYFIPFQNCQGQYVFRKADIDCSGRQPKILINSDSRTVNQQGEACDNDDSCDDADENAENKDPGQASCPCTDDKFDEKCTTQKFALQEAFQKRCPNFISRLQEREEALARIKSERELRAEKKREWIRLYGKDPSGLKQLDSILPPKGPRLMTTKEMREITNRHYKNLPEVQEKVLQKKVEEEKKTNRIMSQVFAQQLRKGVLKGEVNHEHSRSVVRR